MTAIPIRATPASATSTSSRKPGGRRRVAHTCLVAGASGSDDDLAAMLHDGHAHSGNTSFSHFHLLVWTGQEQRRSGSATGQLFRTAFVAVGKLRSMQFSVDWPYGCGLTGADSASSRSPCPRRTCAQRLGIRDEETARKRYFRRRAASRRNGRPKRWRANYGVATIDRIAPFGPARIGRHDFGHAVHRLGPAVQIR